MAEEGILFIHLFDAAGNFVGGADSPPRSGQYSTTVWQKGEGIIDEHPLPADLPSGEYSLKIGMYDAVTQNRLPALNMLGEALPDGMVPLGIVTLP